MSTQACNTTSRRIHDGKSKACGHRTGAGVLGSAPGWTSPHLSNTLKNSSFQRPRSQHLAWPCADMPSAEQKHTLAKASCACPFQATVSHSAIREAACLFLYSTTFLSFVFLKAATQLARQVHQERTQVVCSNKVDRSCLTQRHSHNGPRTYEC